MAVAPLKTSYSSPSEISSDRMKALLVLSDGTVFEGNSFGAEGETIGEIVFNTSMTGYQVILTDPSYKGQIVTMTYTQIGNYGVNSEDTESPGGPKVEGFIVEGILAVSEQLASRGVRSPKSKEQSHTFISRLLKGVQNRWYRRNR